MTSEGDDGRVELRLVLGGGPLGVSAMSSLLRVLQAAVRESARADAAARGLFEEPVAPSLFMTVSTGEGDSPALCFYFGTPDGSVLPAEAASSAFSAFISDLAERLKDLPQPGLWGRAVGGVRQARDESDVSRRMGEVHAELRRLPRSVLSFGGREIFVDGEQIELRYE